MKAKTPTTSCIKKEQSGKLRLARFVLLTVGLMLLAACSSGLDKSPELESSASTKKAESRISSNSDDAEESISSGWVRTYSTDLELSYDSYRGKEGHQLVGLRFRNVKVPQGASIEKAYIQFQTDETDSGSVKVYIRGEDTDNASGFSDSDHNISKRTKTSNRVSWSPDSWYKRGERGSKQRTADLSSIVKEITNRKGWDYGNSMVFVLSSDTTTKRRVAESHNGDSGAAPKLYIEYRGGSSEPRQAPVSSGPSVKSGDIDYYIATWGNDSNKGTKDKPWATLLKAARTVKPGDTVCLRSGTYDGFGEVYAGYDRQAFERDGKSGAPITIMSCPGERATLDGRKRSWKSSSSISSPVLVRITADYYVVRDLTFKNSAGRGLYLSGNHNTVENVTSYSNHSDGVYFKGKYNTAKNVKSYDNYSRQNGGDSADGIKMVGGYKNIIENCNVYDNSDDGVDIWDSTQTTIKNCEAKDNGRGSSGNGRCFKISNGKSNTGNVIENNEATGCIVNFDTNNGSGITLRNNESRNGQVGFSINRSNKAYGNKSYGDRKNHVDGASGSGNSW